MIKIEHTEVVGWEPAIRGMRNPMNSWEKSDTYFFKGTYVQDGKLKSDYFNSKGESPKDDLVGPAVIGPNDHDLMMRLCKAGSTDAKFRRMIICYVDITAPLYMLKELDTYRMGVEKNSCSTMHKIHTKPFTPDDFSHEHLLTIDDLPSDLALMVINVNGDPCYYSPDGQLDIICKALNKYREKYLKTKDKRYWWQMIQLLPSSYNQRRTYMFSYEALSKIYRERHDHKLDDWHTLCDWIETLPYSEIITLKEN